MSERLADRGAEIVDADQIVRELQTPGQPVFEWMVERWGDAVVGHDGRLDRGAVAAIVFAEPSELEALEAVVHPEVRRASDRRVDAAMGTDRVVVLDNPLLAEGLKKAREEGKEPTWRWAQAVIVVDCPVEVAIERLVRYRGFDRDDADRRVAAQVSRDERLALADFVIDNSGDLDQLDAEIDRCWTWLSTLGDYTPT